MYTARKSEIAKLRAYRQELDALYARALTRRDPSRAQAIYDLRRRVHRAILVREEWEAGRAALPAAPRPSILDEADALVEEILGQQGRHAL